MNKTIACPKCNGRGFISGGDDKSIWSKTCDRWHGNCTIDVPMTHGDLIRTMSDEELAKWISGGAMHSDSACSYCEHNKKKTCTGRECQDVTDAEIIMKWLQQPVEE